mgnify:CR=1 FL=1
MFRRLVRYAFQAWELGKEADLEEEARRLGAAILMPFVKSIQEAQKKWVGEYFFLRAPKHIIQEFVQIMDRCGVKIRIIKYENDGALLFRPYQRTTDKMRNYTSGGFCEE